MQEFLASLLVVAVRRALTFLGGGITLSDNDVAKVVGGLMIVGDLLLQAYKHRKATSTSDELKRPFRFDEGA